MEDSNGDSDSLAPGFLIASPKLDDSPFERAVILMVQHDEQGSMGFIVNKPVEMDFGSLLVGVNPQLETQLSESRFEQSVFFGGPVRMGQLWLIHRDPGAAPPDDVRERLELEEDGNLPFADDWVVSASAEVIEDVGRSSSEEPLVPVLGYAGWGGGQLEGEIEEGSWLMCDFDEKLLDVDDVDSLWETSLERTGVDPTAFLMMARGESV